MTERRPLSALLLTLLFLSLSALAGCAVPGVSDGQAALDYADAGFTADVRGTVCRTEPDGYAGPAGLAGESRTGVPWEVSARVTVSAPDEAGRRTVSVTYTSPPSLAGLTVSRTPPDPSDPAARPVVTLTLGSLIFSDDTGAFDGLCFPADALIPEGDLLSEGRDADGLLEVRLSRPLDDAAPVRTLTFSDAALPVRAVMTTDTRTVALFVSPAPAP